MAEAENRQGSEFPGSYFESRELNGRFQDSYGSVKALLEILQEEQNFKPEDWESTGELRKQTKLGRLFFRGQSNHAYGLSSSLHRFLQREFSEKITEIHLSKVENAILKDAQLQGLGKGVTSGQLLMLLQHHSAPTRMIDVSMKPLEALYFAVERDDSKDGRLFVITINDGQKGGGSISLEGDDDLPWTKYAKAGGYSSSDWTQAVKIVDELPLDPRMTSQQGRFLVGGIQRAYANLNIWFNNVQLRVAERQMISMLCIQWPNTTAVKFDSAWPAFAWSIRIPASWKPEIRDILKSDFNISRESIYPNLNEIEWRSEQAGRVELQKISKHS